MGPLSFRPFSKTPYRESIKENVHFPLLHTSEPAALITVLSVGDRVLAAGGDFLARRRAHCHRVSLYWMKKNKNKKIKK